ncbi:MAG: HAD hydrolase-like protein [Peptococcaceae bacterium]|nr:HAD hydrolase-like protein [Peptococcaceae bacterium]
MIKHVLFDFDGTIADSRYLAIELLNKLAELYNFRQLKEEDFEHLRALSIIERCKFMQVPIQAIPAIFISLLKGYNAANLPIYKGMDEVIRSLKKSDYVLSIISSNLVENINNCLKGNNINVFDRVYSGNYFRKDVTIRNYLYKNKLNTEDVVYIGDESRDIVACKLNNIKIIAVSWGYESLQRLVKNNPDFTANSPGELFEIITGRLG